MEVANKIIKQPLISEKGTDLSSLNKYIFLVDGSANKKQIKDALESIYKVKITKVNVVRNRKKAHEYKKAVITIAQGQTIDIVPH